VAVNEMYLDFLDELGLTKVAYDRDTGEKLRRVNRPEVVARFGTAVKGEICDDLDLIEVESKLPSEWRKQVLGETDDELVARLLNELTGQMLSLSGPVQDFLENGLEVGNGGVVLLKTTVRRRGEDGVERVYKGRGRIASGNLAAVQRFHDAVKTAELVRKGQNTRASLDLSGRRIPGLTAARQPMLERGVAEIEQLLLNGASTNGSPEAASTESSPEASTVEA